MPAVKAFLAFQDRHADLRRLVDIAECRANVVPHGKVHCIQLLWTVQADGGHVAVDGDADCFKRWDHACLLFVAATY
jgi:hypothetical protein